jgi:hypothetical protein
VVPESAGRRLRTDGEGFGRYAFGGVKRGGGAGRCGGSVGLDVGCVAMALGGYVALSRVEKEPWASDAARENIFFAPSVRENVSSSSSSSWIAAVGVIVGEGAAVVGFVSMWWWWWW